MKLPPLASNMTEIEKNGVWVLFSYQTLVACHIAGEGTYTIEKKWSPTTSRHVNK